MYPEASQPPFLFVAESSFRQVLFALILSSCPGQPLFSYRLSLLSSSTSVVPVLSGGFRRSIRQHRMIVIGISEQQHLRDHECRFDPCRDEFLCCHAVIFEESHHRERECSHYAEPADGLSPEDGIETKIDAYCYAACQDRKRNCLSDSPKNIDSV